MQHVSNYVECLCSKTTTVQLQRFLCVQWDQLCVWAARERVQPSNTATSVTVRTWACISLTMHRYHETVLLTHDDSFFFTNIQERIINISPPSGHLWRQWNQQQCTSRNLGKKPRQSHYKTKPHSPWTRCWSVHLWSRHGTNHLRLLRCQYGLLPEVSDNQSCLPLPFFFRVTLRTVTSTGTV